MEDDGFEDLLARGRAGEEAAREQLARLMTAEAHDVARRELGPKLRQRLGSLDITQSVVWRAFENIDRFRGRTRAAMRRWLAKQVVNRIRDAADRHGAQKRDVNRERQAGSGIRAADGAAGPRTQVTPSGEAMRREEHEQVRSVLQRLPTEDRRFLERSHEGLTGRELAEEFGMPSAAAARMRRVRIENRAGRLLDEMYGG